MTTIISRFCYDSALATYLLQAAPPALAPVRVLAAMLLVLLLCGLIYVLRHVKSLKAEIKANDVMPTLRGPRNNMIFIACALTFVIVCLLLFLVAKA
jgi:hypothetical protein